jgi:hypothetical protein
MAPWGRRWGYRVAPPKEPSVPLFEVSGQQVHFNDALVAFLAG